ncbi:MAG TPA: TIGR03564 family F420-dependent LLM class oxidoreductase [Dehalococcoidia bacterium]|nr:TIGR03564 family F420-dependent LLM class oxidoreductase [Dehalococcoidia bacterium]
MRIGIMVGGVAGDVERQVQQVADIEADGFDAAWFGQVFDTDVMTVIALAGQRTSRIELGTAVVPVYTRHPHVMAQQALTTQAATGGRFTLGVGLSHHMVVENMWGLSYEKPARYMREYLSVLLPLIAEGKVAFQGQVFRVNANLNVRVPKQPSVMVAALAPQMLKLAGSRADGTLTWMTGVKAVDTHVRPSITAAAQEAGRPAPRIGVGLPVAVTDDAAAARETVSRLFAIYGQLPNYRRMLDKEGAAGPADVAIVGSEREVERHVRDLASAGATDFFAAMFPVGSDPQASLARTRELLKSLVGRV